MVPPVLVQADTILSGPDENDRRPISVHPQRTEPEANVVAAGFPLITICVQGGGPDHIEYTNTHAVSSEERMV